MGNRLADLGVTNSALLIGLGIALGILVLLSIGIAQWLVLRRHVQRAGWWVPANALAWLADVAVPFVGLALAPDGSPLTVWMAAGVASGLLMGAVAGAITGLALARLLRSSHKEESAAGR